MMFFKKKSDLTKREKEIRSYILEEYARTVYYLDEQSTSYANGREKEAMKILGRILDILGG